MDEYKGGFRDAADTAWAEADVLEGAPALYQQGEPAFAQTPQGSKQGIVGPGIDVEFPPVFRLFHRREYSLASALVAGVGEDGHLGSERAGDIQDVLAGGFDVVHVSGKDVGDPQRDAFRGDDRLDVAAEVVGLPGVPKINLFAFLGNGFDAEPVGVDDLAVEDEVGKAVGLGSVEGVMQVGRLGGEDVDDLVEAAVGGGLGQAWDRPNPRPRFGMSTFSRNQMSPNTAWR
jgi:hypothetical protein